MISASGTPSSDATPSSGDDFGIFNEAWPLISNIIIDGFYIQDATDSGIYFIDDSNIWVRNNVIVNSGYNTNLGSENWGGIILTRVPNFLVQNNYVELSGASPKSTSLYAISGADSVAEYNECYLTSSSSNGRCYYVSSSAIRFIFRYNYIHTDAIAQSQYARFRDTTDFSITNNYIQSTVPQYFMIVHENTNGGIIEGHKINNNTFVYNQGAISNAVILGLGFLDNSEVKNSIFYSGVSDTTDSFGIGQAWCSPSNSITIDNNIYYNLRNLVQPKLGNYTITSCYSGDGVNVGGYTETNTQNLNPNINTATGCASSVNNNTYGANLNVSNVPYRKCDGTFYTASGKFGINVVVSDSGTPPPDTTPPSAPTGLAVN